MNWAVVLVLSGILITQRATPLAVAGVMWVAEHPMSNTVFLRRLQTHLGPRAALDLKEN